jgi:hypothetical protein
MVKQGRECNRVSPAQQKVQPGGLAAGTSGSIGSKKQNLDKIPGKT